MILNVSNVCKSFADTLIIDKASFVIEDNEKVAIVGINGAGKSTLLNIISNNISKDSGLVTLSKDKKMSFLKQINNINSNLSVYEEMRLVVKHIFDMQDNIFKISEKIKLANKEEIDNLYDEYSSLNHKFELLDGYKIESKIFGILNGLGFNKEDFNKQISSLSGGEKTRLSLAKILLEEPDLILLDEPTNHLDLQSVEWLENYLKNYKGAVIVVSHDRFFINKIATKIIDIDNTKVNTYLGNYTDFCTKKEAFKKAYEKAYEKQQKEIKHQEEVIAKLKSFNREKSIKRAESREKQLEKMEKIEKLEEKKAEMQLEFNTELQSSKDVLNVYSLSKSFDETELFSNLSFEIKRGERIALIGENGSGKTSILKIIMNILDSDKRELNFGNNVTVAYYDQEHQILDENKTIFDEIQDTYKDLNDTKIRTILSTFLFTKDDVFKKISSLSGGERARVSLVKLILNKSNFLILDEPTNHLDIVSKEILEKALINFKGTVLFVSHDRYFINQVATRILNLKNKKLLNYIGNYDYYIEKRETIENLHFVNINQANKINIESENKSTWIANKELQKKEKKRKKDLENLEKNISSLENKISQIEEKFLDESLQSDFIELGKLQKEKESLEKELANLYTKWEELMLFDE